MFIEQKMWGFAVDISTWFKVKIPLCIPNEALSVVCFFLIIIKCQKGIIRIDSFGGYILGRAKKSITIKAPPEKVWEMLAFDKLPEWDEGYGSGIALGVKYTSEVHTPKDKYRVGATAQGIPKKHGDDYCNFKITESLEKKKMSYRAWEETKYFGTLSQFTTHSLESVGTDTKLTCELESERFLGIFGKFLVKLYLRRWTEKKMRKELENLKSILEK